MGRECNLQPEITTSTIGSEIQWCESNRKENDRKVKLLGFLSFREASEQSEHSGSVPVQFRSECSDRLFFGSVGTYKDYNFLIFSFLCFLLEV